MSHPIDVIIPTRNRGALVTRTLESLQANRYKDFHVWIIDQSDNSDTETAVQPFVDQDSRFSLIKTNTIGANVARNLGLSLSSAPLVLFTDDDCRVAPNWIEAYAAEYEMHPTIAAIFGKIYQGEIPGDMDLDSHLNVAEAKKLQKIMPVAKKEESEPKLFKDNPLDTGFGHGANMSFRRDTFKQVGLFDEYLGYGNALGSWDERDIGYRIIAQGGQILYSPNAVIYHDHWREWPALKNSFKNYAIGTGAVVGKYTRLGDRQSIKLLTDWLIQQGFRQVFSGIFKWQSWHKIQAGLLQLIYPWIGLWKSRQYAIDPHYRVYIGKKDHPHKVPTIKPPL